MPNLGRFHLALAALALEILSDLWGNADVAGTLVQLVRGCRARDGAGAGIGRATALRFAEAGAAIVVTDIKAETAQSVASTITAAGGKAVGLACDVTQEAQLQAAVDAAVASFGSLTLLVNNAGGGGPKPFDMPMSDFEWAYKLNVFSLFRLTQLAAPHMKAAGGGAVVNISSMAGENKNVRMASYGSSKAAVNHLTVTLPSTSVPWGSGSMPLRRVPSRPMRLPRC